MLAVAVNGSPHKKGNTYDLLNQVLQPLKEAGWDTQLLQVGGTPIKPCTACFGCFKRKDKTCVLPPDSFAGIMPELLKADAIILGSPTYYANITGEMKSLLDRVGFVATANGGLLQGKIGASVVAMRRAGGVIAFDAMNRLFLISGMLVPGSTYWNIGVGMAPGEVVKDQEGMANMTHLGRTIAWLGKAIQPHQSAFPPLTPY